MKRERIVVLGVVVLALFCFSGVVVTAFAYDQNSAPQGATRVVTGTVAEVDAAAGKIIVEVPDDELTFYVPANAVMTLGDRTISLADVSYGDDVRIEYYAIPNSFAGLMVARLYDLNYEKEAY